MVILDWIVTGAGAVIVVLTLRDIFNMLWRPSGEGRLAASVMRVVWRLGRSRPSSPTGPLSLVLVVLVWAALLAAGFALVYWPHMPEGFVYGSGLDVSERSDLLDAAYLSMVTLATLGYGDIVPDEGWLRVVGPIEAFAGFALWTAAVSWIMQIYPVLSRRRALALRFSLLDRTDRGAAVGSADSSAWAALVHSLAADVAMIRADAEQYGESAYFRDATPALSLAAQLPYGLEIARRSCTSSREDVRAAGALLEAGIDDLAHALAARFGDGDPGDVDAAVHAVARAHGRD